MPVCAHAILGIAASSTKVQGRKTWVDVLQSTQVLRAGARGRRVARPQVRQGVSALGRVGVERRVGTAQTIGIPQGAKPQGASKKRKYSQTPFTIQKALMPGI